MPVAPSVTYALGGTRPSFSSLEKFLAGSILRQIHFRFLLPNAHALLSILWAIFIVLVVEPK